MNSNQLPKKYLPPWCHPVLYTSVVVCVVAVCWYLIRDNNGGWKCHIDYTNNEAMMCHLKCPNKYYSLPGMNECVPWLTCHDINSPEFRVVKPLGNGAVKMVYLVEWRGHQVVLNTLLNPLYKSDFQYGLEMLISLQEYSHVTQLVGNCGNAYVTEYHKLGSAENINDILDRDVLHAYNNIETRLGLCISYAEILNFLHNSPIGTRVMCDSNDLEKTLNQFLLRDDLTLIVNDLDALPEAQGSSGKLIKCGHREIQGEFPAPEQLWPYRDIQFDDSMMPLYDEKTDIWKIADVCNHFLGDVSGSDAVRFHLFKIHKQCKQESHHQRPSAGQVLDAYISTQEEMGF